VAWAVCIEGRSDPGGILFLIGDGAEAESLASEIRQRGVPAVARPVRHSRQLSEQRKPAFTLTDLAVEDPLEPRVERALRRR
jgi:hypothetical protein